ncbi:phosphopantetheine-binding protein [Streptomyces sp. NPDC032940]|uniref:phosphopantetheine-binding protein n=1 Tax=Streptomyces sp. NPDC032940 TaxID=3155366 RepID=UPI0033DD5B5F
MSDPSSAPVDEVDLDGDPVDVVAAVWAAALGVDAVDPQEGFFDLGATSAMVVDVVRVLRRRWPGLKIVDVFSRPTVAQLAAHLGDG